MNWLKLLPPLLVDQLQAFDFDVVIQFNGWIIHLNEICLQQFIIIMGRVVQCWWSTALFQSLFGEPVDLFDLVEGILIG